MHPRRPDRRRSEEHVHRARQGDFIFINSCSRTGNSTDVVFCSKETKHRTLLAYKHRVSVLCPPGAVDLDAITTESQAMDAIARYSEEEVGFLQTFNIHRDGAGDGEVSLFLLIVV